MCGQEHRTIDGELPQRGDEGGWQHSAKEALSQEDSNASTCHGLHRGSARGDQHRLLSAQAVVANLRISVIPQTYLYGEKQLEVAYQ
jgi:hypothetical protein